MFIVSTNVTLQPGI